jgi:putative ABC transport system substrate-binding protein
VRRREFITLLGGAVAGWPLAASAQQGERMRRIGVLLPAAANDPEFQARIRAFQQGLEQSGWSIGRNIQLDMRWATPDAAKIRQQAAELVALAGCHFYDWWEYHAGVATGHSHATDRVCAGP